MALVNFNASEVEPSAPMGAWQPGKYNVEISSADVKTTKSGDGHYVQVEFTAMNGAMERRKHWERYNISNPNQTAEEIAKRNFAALCLAVNLPQLQDTDQLIGRQCVLDTGTRLPKGGGEMETTIRGYYPSGTATPAAITRSVPAAAAAPAVASVPPWKKSA